MKQTYKVSWQLKGFIILTSLLLQSCDSTFSSTTQGSPELKFNYHIKSESITDGGEHKEEKQPFYEERELDEEENELINNIINNGVKGSGTLSLYRKQMKSKKIMKIVGNCSFLENYLKNMHKVKNKTKKIS